MIKLILKHKIVETAINTFFDRIATAFNVPTLNKIYRVGDHVHYIKCNRSDWWGDTHIIVYFMRDLTITRIYSDGSMVLMVNDSNLMGIDTDGRSWPATYVRDEIKVNVNDLIYID